MTNKIEFKRMRLGLKTISAELLPTIVTDKHTKKCHDRYIRELGMETDWKQRWPRHCEVCRGWGVITWQENQSPLGSGHYWPETLSEPCEGCTAYGKCARCGHQHEDDWEANNNPCEFCGWKWGEPGHPHDVMPEVDECYCWEEEQEDEDSRI